MNERMKFEKTFMVDGKTATNHVVNTNIKKISRRNYWLSCRAIPGSGIQISNVHKLDSFRVRLANSVRKNEHARPPPPVPFSGCCCRLGVVAFVEGVDEDWEERL